MYHTVPKITMLTKTSKQRNNQKSKSVSIRTRFNLKVIFYD